MNRSGYILCFVMFFLVVSCKDVYDRYDGVEDDLSIISMTSTKGVGSGNAYRIGLDGIDGTVTEGVSASGTYYDKASGMELVPCRVDSEGNYVEENAASGLRAINGGYKMHISYPALEMTQIVGADGDEQMYGYLVKRKPLEGDVSMFFSESIDVTLSGVYIKPDSGNASEYVFDASSMPLKQPLSKIDVTFACGDKIASATLQKIKFNNIISEGYYMPSEEVFYYALDKIIYNYIVFDAEEGGLTLSRSQKQHLDVEDEFFLSMNYAEKDAQGNTKWPQPELLIEIGETEDEIVEFAAPLGWDFLPQHEYDLTITINSTYINIEVTVAPWDVVEEEKTDVGGVLEWIIVIPLENPLEWEKGDEITGSIE